jgi:hypothetical protein
MADDSARVSDRELLARMCAAKTESSSYLWLLVPLATIPVGAIYGEKAALVAVLGSVALCVLLMQLRDYLPRFQAARLAEREYKRRYRLYDIEDYEAEALVALDKPNAPDVMLLFAGRSLPDGVNHFVRIDLGDAPRLQIRRAPLPSDVLQDETAETKLFRYDRPLSAAQDQRARQLIATLTADNLSPPNHTILDGFPCKAAILRRAHEPIWTELNMAALPAEISAHPAAHFLQLFIDLEAEVVQPNR